MSISRAGLIDWILIDLVNHVSARMVVGFGNGIYVKAIFRSDMFRVVLAPTKSENGMNICAFGSR